MTQPTEAIPLEAHQFDFWLGDWDCSWGEDQHAHNRVTAILNGRVIQESFDGAPAVALKGLSLSVYNVSTRQWRQTWVDDSGSYWAFAGGFHEGRMTLSTEDIDSDGRPVLRRMVWHDISPQTFDWNWEKSADDGLTWQALWQIHYRRIA